ncbi:hypothetical protein [Salinicoccus roseus]|uniref:hypothetical protein n=1 Tax=Salinicoccus roseus TaxID=45670 RepID=UPI0023013C09|nr:hypothetical protein [Salinicoccus roseus]
MRLIFFSIISLLILSSCQSNENSEETADNTEPNTEEATVESSDESANNEASEETTSNEQPDTNESPEESTEENKNSENEEEEERSTDEPNDESNDNVRNQNATSFDIHSDEVQQALFSPSSVEEENLTFSQDVITQGMSRSEVEERYGTYDLIYPGGGAPVVIYGNLGVVYSDSRPFIPSKDPGDENTNPDENNVQDVFFYAGLSYNKVVEALGAPDVDVYETEGGPVGGVQRMEYVIEDKENSTVKGVFVLHDNKAGEEIVGRMMTIEEPDDADESTAQQPEESEDIDIEEEERITIFINGYIDDLMDYFNNGSEDILMHTRETSPNYEKISANKASENYRNHETYELNINNITPAGGSAYEVTVSREYSHATSNGRSITEVEYSMVNTPQGFMMYDYQELNNESVE